MSTKIDFITYLKSTLVSASSKLKSAQPPDLNTAVRLDQIVRTSSSAAVFMVCMFLRWPCSCEPKPKFTRRRPNGPNCSGERMTDQLAALHDIESRLFNGCE
jgi:hypothetical protein